MENHDIRREMRANFVPMWKIAKLLGISEPTLTRWMRVELTPEKRKRILEAINQLKQEVVNEEV